jgi:protein-tyrosine phosphatase
MSSSGVRVLAVCTGNICRSPMMERILREAFLRHDAGDLLSVTSAGTWAQPGEPMQPFAEATLAERGVDPSGFVARRVTEEAVQASDLVLTATLEHRGSVVGLVPGAVRRAFTLLELARITLSAPPVPSLEGGSTADGVRRAIAWAAQMRGATPRSTEDVDDLEDPLGAPRGVYRARADQITAAVDQIVPFLIGSGSGR